MKFSIFTGKKLYITLHILAWTILFFLPAYFLFSDPGYNHFFKIIFYTQVFAYALIFYLNYFWLLPKFFFSRKKGLYILWTTVLIIGLYVIIEFSNNVFFSNENKIYNDKFNTIAKEYNLPKPTRKGHTINYLFTSILISGFSIGLRVSGKLSQEEKQRKEADKERLNAELALLKNQVSPHFFFNTLNNIYSLVEINTDDAQKAILKLSKLMRYLLYESENGDTTLSREIEFMKNYIDLMILRVSSKVNLSVSFPEKYNDVTIAPLLFISFIENAFKHGISYREKSFIEIALNINNTVIEFSCSNSINIHKDEAIENIAGIGLENVRKRLALLYPNNHTLTISSKEEIYEVLLTINSI